jgi:hypothetical protein
MEQKGVIGDAISTGVKGLGGGALFNIADKKLAKGWFTQHGVKLGAQTINGKQLTLNLTDAGALLITNGLKVPKTKDIIWMLAILGIKKYAEAYEYIDPWEPEAPAPAAQNQQPPAIPQLSTYAGFTSPNFSGGIHS